MKKLLLCIGFLSFYSLTHAQIIYTDYGDEGLRVAMNENLPMDLDNDGNIDFYVNGYDNELGFSAIFGLGCFASPSESAYTSFDARELQIFTEDETVLMDGNNFFDYIDDGRGSIYHGDGVFADNWEDGVDQYVGFALVLQSTMDGWMRVAVDKTNNEMIIYEWAYKLQDPSGTPTGIRVGDSGLSSVNDLGNSLDNLQLGPNPASDVLKLSFDYNGDEPLYLTVVDLNGKVVYNHLDKYATGLHSVELNTSLWSSGMYYVKLSNTRGVQSSKVTITK